MDIRSILAALAALIGLLLGQGDAPAASIVPPASPVFQQAAECPWPEAADRAIRGTVQCGWLTVPLRHAVPDGPTLQVPLGIITPRRANPAAEPVILLDGGPGGNGGFFFTLLYDSPPAWADRTLVVLGQRGTEWSRPALMCPEILGYTKTVAGQNLGWEEEAAGNERAALACRARLASQGVDLAAFNSIESAGDVAAIRRALNLERVSLYGVSYGSRLALETMRRYPEGIRAVILDGVWPPQADITEQPQVVDNAYSTLFRACAASQSCRSAFGDLEATTFAVAERLNQRPARIEVDDDAGELVPVVLDGPLFLGALFNLMYDSGAIPELPLIIERARRGNYDALAPVLSYILFDPSFAIGMSTSVNCSEEGRFDPRAVQRTIRRQLIENYAVREVELFAQLCSRWDVPLAAPDIDQPVSSTIPTLILNGFFDPITPPSYGEAAAQTLPSSYVYTFPNGAHGSLDRRCPAQIMRAFLENPGRAPDSSCIGQIPAVRFLTN